MFYSFKTKRDNDIRSENSTTSCNIVSSTPSIISKSDREEEKQLNAKISPSLMNDPSLIKEQIQEKYRYVLI